VLPGRAPAQGGAKVNYETPSFPIYNQRTDVELSTGGSS
jgi:multiple sugar transport system substrate-binding protein